MAPTLTRTQFDKACKLFVAFCSDDAAHAFPRGSSCGWAWKEHVSLPGLGFLSRSILLSRNSGNTLNGEVEGQDDIGLATSDDSEACSPSADLLTSHQSVVYSPTFQVPTFYFTLHDTSACALWTYPATLLT
ncbi:hypothetical protein A0H81_08297 [Grifola frondosa]|uniref:Uncharacterized protein n=1 Tax=Grifola frondosa TaxID=5627 RepID=A0A1C7M4F1_GRIFR|nr:hypothetical protein A0H81_08297 [Grifola frondosa]